MSLDHPIKGEVCYFKNLFTTDDGSAIKTLKLRKRLRLEYAIRSKMQMLKRDWNQFLKTNYPELFNNEVPEDNEMKP
jgi:hypothetical protein